MKKKIFTIIGIVAFIVILLVANVFLKKENQKMVSQSSQPVIQKEAEESKAGILEVTSSNFEEEVLNSDKTVLIDFYADWCEPCKILSPIVVQIAKENPDIKVVKIDLDANQDLAMEYEIISIPTLVVIKDGVEANRAVGVIAKTEIQELIK